MNTCPILTIIYQFVGLRSVTLSTHIVCHCIMTGHMAGVFLALVMKLRLLYRLIQVAGLPR